MYPKHKKLLAVLWLIGLFVGVSFRINLSIDFLSQAITVLSIFFGFYVTSAAMVSSSTFFRKLHQEIDARNPNKKLSQTLRDYYAFGLKSLLIGIALFLLVTFFTTALEKTASVLRFVNSAPQICLSMENIAISWGARILSSLAIAQLMVCMGFAFIKTRLFVTIFINSAYSHEVKK